MEWHRHPDQDQRQRHVQAAHLSGRAWHEEHHRRAVCHVLPPQSQRDGVPGQLRHKPKYKLVFQYTVRLDAIPRASSFFLLLETNASPTLLDVSIHRPINYNYDYSNVGSDNSRRNAYRTKGDGFGMFAHDKTGNELFADYHVKTLKPHALALPRDTGMDGEGTGIATVHNWGTYHSNLTPAANIPYPFIRYYNVN